MSGDKVGQFFISGRQIIMAATQLGAAAVMGKQTVLPFTV
jgi:hypothetical protein